MPLARAPRALLVFLPVALMYLGVWTVARSALWSLRPEVVAAGCLFDLTLTSAFIVWFFGVRPGHLDLRWLVPVLGAGLLTAGYALPESAVTGGARTVLMVLEAMLAAVFLVSLGQISTAYRERTAAGVGRIEALEAALRAHLPVPAAASAIAAEVGLLAYAFAGWFKKPSEDQAAFTTHREAGWYTLFAVILGIVGAEAWVLHVIVVGYSEVAAWGIGALHVYSVLWLVGDLHALRLRPVRVTAETIEVRVGLRWRASIARENVLAVEPAAAEPPGPHVDASVFKCENVTITLKSPVELHGPFGIKKTAISIGLSIDGLDEFLEQARPPRSVLE